MSHAIVAGVEMGGTKCICTLGSGPDDVRAQQVLPTGDPAGTLAMIAQVLREWEARVATFAAIGVACFGPLDLRPGSRTYGRIGATPKALWRHVNVYRFFAERFAVPVGLTTDVIGAALAEGRWGAARALADYAYVTVGTGVGVGLVAAGRPLIGCHHPELGHVRVARAPGDHWPGHCAFHGDCVEGLASGPAIEARSGMPAGSVPEHNPVWDTVAHALGQLAHILVVSVAPQRILIGGGVVGAQPHLLARIRRSLATSLNGYLDLEELRSGLDRYLDAPGLGSRAGPLGALALAADTHAAHTAPGGAQAPRPPISPGGGSSRA